MNSQTNPKSILLACASGQLGGTELRMLEEGRALQAMGYQVAVATPPFGRGSRFQTLLAESHISHVEFKPPAILNNWRWRYPEFFRAQFTDRRLMQSADLVHVFMPWTNQGLDQLWQANKSGVSTILSIHNAFTLNRPLSSWHQKHLASAFACVRGVYGVSRQALVNFDEIFARFVGSDVRRDVIYNFVDLERFLPSDELRQATRRKLGLSDGVPLFGSVGRLDKQKRPLSLLEAFRHIGEVMPNAHFLLIGQGPLECEVQNKLHQLNLSERTVVLPFQEDVEAYFPALDVHLLLSRNEGFGIVTAEALACGVPVVGSDVVGTREVIDDCAAGKLVPLGDEEAAAAAALELYGRRAELAAIGRQYVESRFSKEIWQSKIEVFYDAILARHRSSSR